MNILSVCGSIFPKLNIMSFVGKKTKGKVKIISLCSTFFYNSPHPNWQSTIALSCVDWCGRRLNFDCVKMEREHPGEVRILFLVSAVVLTIYSQLPYTIDYNCHRQSSVFVLVAYTVEQDNLKWMWKEVSKRIEWLMLEKGPMNLCQI